MQCPKLSISLVGLPRETKRLFKSPKVLLQPSFSLPPEALTILGKTRKFRGEFEWNGSPRWKFSGKKVIPFEVLPKRPKLSVPFVWITSTSLQVERKRKIYRYFVNGTTQCSCFLCPKKYQYHLMEFFHRISLQMVSAPGQLKNQRRQVFPRSNKLNKETPRALKK